MQVMQARASGILLPVFSLPGPYGIGTLGQPARRFIDFLAEGGQKFWQILPLVPPGGGDSPYGLTEFLIADGSQAEIAFTCSTEEFAAWLAEQA